MTMLCLECGLAREVGERHVDEECPDCGSPELRAAEAVEVTFHPQVWQDDRAVTGTDTVSWRVPIMDAVDNDHRLPEDNTYESDRLRDHENAPEKAKLWQGPFYVTVGEIIGLTAPE